MGEHWAEVIFDSVSDGIILAGPDWRVRTINSAAERLLQVSRDELVNRVLGQEYRPVGPREAAALREVMETRRPRTLRDIKLTAPGLVGRRFDAQVDPCEDGGIVLVFRDATERVRLEEEARTAAQEAQATSRARSEFLAMMSHELRTPLNAIIGYSDLLETQLAGPLTERQRIYLERLRASARHLLGLLTDVLDMAKGDAGRLSVRREVAQPLHAVESALAIVRPDAATQRLGLSVTCPAEGATAYVGDEQRVRQILVNLLSNAVKFTEPGGRITVTCGTTQHPEAEADLADSGEWLYIRVADTGIGIAAEQLATVFEPFMQVEAGHTRRRGGSGLGLTISRRLARLMGGDLTGVSRLGHGSTFTLWLPAAPQGAQVADATALGRLVKRDGSLTGLRELGDMLGRRIHDVVESYVHRLRALPIVPHAGPMSDTDLEDHVASFLADLAQSLEIIERTGGEPTDIIRDGSALQRLIAERHGALRYRLGWTEDALAREFAIMYEELERVAREAPPAGADVESALDLLKRLLDYTKAVSLRGFRHAAAEATT